MRQKMYQVFHSLLVNITSRPKTLEYISTILRYNARRSQLASDEKVLARDGLMINLMSVLQQLSVKVKLDRVDPQYLFYAKPLITVHDDTKLRFTKEEYEKYKNSDAVVKNDPTINTDYKKAIVVVSFQTHCWYLAMQSHHLGFMPAIQRYRQKSRAIKELQKLIGELDRTKVHWENTPYAIRNKQFRDRWNKQLKKLTRS